MRPVYSHAHVGNMRAYVFADVLRRTLEANGYAVDHVMNITDVGTSPAMPTKARTRMTAIRRHSTGVSGTAFRSGALGDAAAGARPILPRYRARVSW